MKRIIILFLFFTIRSYAQYDTAYYRIYGGVSFDEGRDVKETYDKGYIIAGTTSSFGQGNSSIYLIKTDSLGKFMWSQVYGGTQNDWDYNVQITSDSGFFVSGYSNSFGPAQQTGNDAFYFKTDKNGVLLWQKIVVGADWDFIYGCTPLPDGGYVLCGKTYTNSNGGADAYLIRLTKSGDTLWTRHYGGAFDETLNSVCFINNRIYAAGSNSTHPTDTAADGWIIQVDTSGTKLNETFFNIAPSAHTEEIWFGINPYGTDKFHVCGSAFVPDSNATVGIVNLYDTALVAASVYSTIIGDVTNGYYITLNKVIQIPYGNICAIGTTNGPIGGKDIYTVGLDAAGGWWIDSFRHSGGSENDYGYSTILTSGGKLVAVGSSQNYCSGSSGLNALGHPNPSINNIPGMGSEDVFLLRLNRSDSMTKVPIPNEVCYSDTLFYWVSSIKNNTSNVNAVLYPNPANQTTQLEIKSESHSTFNVSVSSLLGAEVMNFKASTGNNQLDFSNLPNGSYFLKLESSNKQETRTLKFILLK